MPQRYWELAYAADGARGSLQDYITGRYLGLIRNFHRWSWLLIYLFGASPAVCASFLRGRQGHGLEPMDPEGNTLYRPHATSLRMGGLGYNSEAQRGLAVCYNDLDSYLETLKTAILTPHPAYAQFPTGEGGDYQQLNGSLLQIENEFYSTIRPKRVAASGETALTALRRGGIEYIEVRCLDVNPFTPLGLDAETIRFLDAFLLHCLVEDSPPCSPAEQLVLDDNLATVVDRGREPGLTLDSAAGRRPLAGLAGERLQGVARTAALLDAAHGDGSYRAAVAAQEAKVSDPAATPSARMLAEMVRDGLPFYRFGLRYSEHWGRYFRERAPAAAALTALEAETERSLAAQHELEAADSLDFASYLAAYYAQYAAL
jgi:glutamate--cysteine ligase